MKQIVKQFEDKFPLDELSIAVVQKMVRGEKHNRASISVNKLLVFTEAHREGGG